MAHDTILNAEQLRAISYGDGPLLIIAGAGTGKTTVITERIKYLITKKHVLPSEILALTFTEKAAKEMEERVDMAMPYGYSQMWIATFHAFCDRILRNEAIHIGLSPNYTLMSQSDTILFLRQHVFAFHLDYFRPLGNPNKFLEGLSQHFSRLADEDISPSEYIAWVSGNGEKLIESKKNNELAQTFQIYQDLKGKEGVMDFADVISNTLLLFRKRKNILANYQNQFKYILVDEFQDTNFAQNQLAILLAKDKQNITVVGDDDQAIYRWRGAAISNMIQFKTHFPKTSIITLTQNYRSSQEILDRAYDLIQYNNPDRLETKENINKKLIAWRKTKNHAIELIFEQRVEDEADCVAKKIQELIQKEKRAYKDFAILVRANDHAQPFVKAFQRYGIPYQFLGPGRLFRQEEIKDLIAYLKVLTNLEDSTSLYRVLTLPFFEIPARDVSTLLTLAKKKSLSLFEVLELVDETTIQTREMPIKESVYTQIKKLVSMIKRHLERVSKDSAGQILYYFLQDTGLLTKFLAARSEKEVKQYQNVAKFFDKLKSFEAEHDDARVFAVVDWVDLAMQMGESPLAADIDWSENNAVNMLTIHSSKGLEFPVVFLVNLVSQRFPTRERREQIPLPTEIIKEILPEGDYHLQEERRLFYVGMTRARDRLYFTAAKFYGEGKRDRKLSPFVYEALRKEVIEKFLQQQKLQKTVVQQSLLDWTDQFVETNQLKTKDQRPMTKLTYVSYSQLQCFAICPLHYKLQYLLKIPGQPTAALSFGNSLHYALGDFYQAAITNKNIQPEDIIPMFEKQWIDEGYTSKEHKKEAFEQGKYIAYRYVKDNFRKKIKTVGIEVPFQFIIKDSKFAPQGLKIGGRIDRIDLLDNGKIEIIDYKTGINVPTEKELQANFQLTVYALAVTLVHEPILQQKPEDIILSLYYLEEEKKLTTTRTREQVEEAKTLILQKVKEIEQSDFACSNSIFCQNCEYKMLCSTSS